MQLQHPSRISFQSPFRILGMFKNMFKNIFEDVYEILLFTSFRPLFRIVSDFRPLFLFGRSCSIVSCAILQAWCLRAKVSHTLRGEFRIALAFTLCRNSSSELLQFAPLRGWIHLNRRMLGRQVGSMLGLGWTHIGAMSSPWPCLGFILPLIGAIFAKFCPLLGPC